MNDQRLAYRGLGRVQVKEEKSVASTLERSTQRVAAKPPSALGVSSDDPTAKLFCVGGPEKDLVAAILRKNTLTAASLIEQILDPG